MHQLHQCFLLLPLLQDYLLLQLRPYFQLPQRPQLLLLRPSPQYSL